MNHHENARTHYYASVLIVERVLQHFEGACSVLQAIWVFVERSAYKWLERYRQAGWSGLK